MPPIRTKCDLCGGKKFTASAVATYEINKYGKLEQTSNVLDDDFVHCTDPLCPAVYNKDEFKIQEEKKPDPPVINTRTAYCTGKDDCGCDLCKHQKDCECDKCNPEEPEE